MTINYKSKLKLYQVNNDFLSNPNFNCMKSFVFKIKLTL